MQMNAVVERLLGAAWVGSLELPLVVGNCRRYASLQKTAANLLRTNAWQGALLWAPQAASVKGVARPQTQ